MAELAKRIRVVQSMGRSLIEIDGEEFPWYVSERGVDVHVSRDDAPAVTVTILAEQVDVDHSLRRRPDPEKIVDDVRAKIDRLRLGGIEPREIRLQPDGWDAITDHYEPPRRTPPSLWGLPVVLDDQLDPDDWYIVTPPARHEIEIERG